MIENRKKAILIAEKPSLMNTIQEVYRKNEEKIPYKIDFESQRGHLLTLMPPNEIDEVYKKWSWETLPFHPEDHGGFKYKIIEEKKTGNYLTASERYSKIKNKINTGNYDFIINAGDPDQEGELLIRLVLDRVKTKLPIKRFWSNDLTEKKVLDALLHLRDDEHDETLKNLLSAAYGRQHSDYRFGMNLSRAATLRMGGRVALGRVKTPILSIVVKREKEILNFKPKTLYGVKVIYEKGFEGVLIKEPTPEKEDGEIIWFKEKEEALNAIKNLRADGNVLANIIKCKKIRIEKVPPKLFKLATAQTSAGALGYNATETLQILQSLYEKKLISYPRTSCEYLSSEENLIDLLNVSKQVSLLSPFVEKIKQFDIRNVKNNKKWINDEALKESGHSAIIPTTSTPNLSKLTKEEKEIYTMIAKQFAAMFLPPAIQDELLVISEVKGYKFRSTGKTLVQLGYLEVFQKKITDTSLPFCEKGMTLAIQKYDCSEKTSTCPKRYTTPNIIAICENPVRYLNDATLKKLKKKLSIGTPATRSNIIDELVKKDGYLISEKNGKASVVKPSEIGMAIIENLEGSNICKVNMTGEWEKQLEMVRKGEISLQTFEENMRIVVEEMICDIKNRKVKQLVISNGKYTATEACPKSAMQTQYVCPACGKKIYEKEKCYACEGTKDQSCNVWLAKSIAGVAIPKEEINNLFTKGTTNKITGFTSTAKQKNYSAALQVDSTNKKIIFKY